MNYDDQNDDVLASEVHRRGLPYTPSEAMDLGRARMIELLTEMDSFEEPVAASGYSGRARSRCYFVGWHVAFAVVTLPIWIGPFVADLIRNPPRRWS